MRSRNLPQLDVFCLTIPEAELVTADRREPDVAVGIHMGAVAADVAHHTLFIDYHAFRIHVEAVDLAGFGIQTTQVLALELSPEHMAFRIDGQIVRKQVLPDGIRIPPLSAVHVRFRIVLVVAQGEMTPLSGAWIHAADADQAVGPPQVAVVVDMGLVHAVLARLIRRTLGEVFPRTQRCQVLDEHGRGQNLFVQRVFHVKPEQSRLAIRPEILGQIISQEVMLLRRDAARRVWICERTTGVQHDAHHGMPAHPVHAMGGQERCTVTGQASGFRQVATGPGRVHLVIGDQPGSFLHTPELGARLGAVLQRQDEVRARLQVQIKLHAGPILQSQPLVF